MLTVGWEGQGPARGWLNRSSGSPVNTRTAIAPREEEQTLQPWGGEGGSAQSSTQGNRGSRLREDLNSQARERSCVIGSHQEGSWAGCPKQKDACRGQMKGRLREQVQTQEAKEERPRPRARLKRGVRNWEERMATRLGDTAKLRGAADHTAGQWGAARAGEARLQGRREGGLRLRVDRKIGWHRPLPQQRQVPRGWKSQLEGWQGHLTTTAQEMLTAGPGGGRHSV